MATEEPRMIDEKRTTRLGKKISCGTAPLSEIAEFVAHFMADAVGKVNQLFSPRQLIKRDRASDPLPTDKRQLSSYRTRLGTVLEYALSTNIDSEIERRFKSDLRLTFAVAHEYPDFYVRDAVLGPRIRIEMKAVDADSDEQSARFEVLTGLIQGDKDVVVLVGWQWHKDVLPNGTQCEYPEIFSFVVVPAADLATERDKSVVLRGGRVEPTRILVPSKKKKGRLTEDKGNAGKILRIVHQSRKAEPFALSGYILKYLQFVSTVEERAAAARKARKKATPPGRKRGYGR
jgi:hypothetical protein